jgi:tyrosyl-tRNA synthetase
VPKSAEEQFRTLRAGTVDCIREDDLRERLASGRPLRVKLGIDPTASDLHLGFAVVLRKLRQFQDLGHTAVLIIGDFTARVGDPSGRSATRPQLSTAEIDEHARTYLEQVRRILDFDGDRIEVRRNSEWLDRLDMAQILQLTSRVTVAQILERNDFAQRMAAGSPVALMELLYPLLQGLDSVEIRADVELGGTDQLFNNLMGRHLQTQAGQTPQVVLTTPLLEGIHGGDKMSKSLGNYVGIAEPPGEQFGKLMSIPDDLMAQYFALTTGWGPDEVEAVTGELAAAAPAARGALKRRLARAVADLYHGPGAGEAAEGEFDRVFRDHAVPADVPEVTVGPGELFEGRIEVAKLLQLAGLTPSNKEGRRQITQGGVSVDGERVGDPKATLAAAELDGRLLQVGKRRWARVRFEG